MDAKKTSRWDARLVLQILFLFFYRKQFTIDRCFSGCGSDELVLESGLEKWIDGTLRLNEHDYYGSRTKRRVATNHAIAC